MQIIRDIKNMPAEWQGNVLALGNFDGIHRGHCALLKESVSLAGQYGAMPAVMTFSPHPREFFSTDKKPVSIYSLRQKAGCIASAGIEKLYVMRFNRAFSALSAYDFISDILWKTLRVRHVLTGYNFAFGKGRGGNTELLAQLSKEFGFGFTAMPAVENNGEIISTSAIRAALKVGDICKASYMLGHQYALEGHIIHGHKRGNALGFPTANIRIRHLYTPRFGVYAVRVYVDGGWYGGAASIGINPTFGNNDPILEVHIFDFEKAVYGKVMRVEFMGFIRDEQKFADVAALRTQMESDVAMAKEMLKDVV